MWWLIIRAIRRAQQRRRLPPFISSRTWAAKPPPRTRPGRVHSTNDRIVGLVVVSLTLVAGLWLRCVWIQILGAPRYRRMATAQHHVTQHVAARRGTIFDRHGRPLVLTAPAPSVFANPRHVTDVQQTVRRLTKLVDTDPRVVERRLASNKGFVWIARQLDPSQLPGLQREAHGGVYLREESRRYYPQGSLASHLVGFVDIDHRGLEGLELTLNGVLAGSDGWRITRRNGRGDVLIGSWTSQVAPTHGLDIVLTIDSVVQQVAEEQLAWGLEKYNAKGGSVIIMEPATGAILAMANAPTYHPAEARTTPPEHRRNRAITDQFEPGSVFKVVTAAALLEEGRITLEEPIFCEEGSFRVPGHTLKDHHPYGTLSFHDVITKSSNIGVAKSAQRLTPQEFYDYIRAFGFGRPTGIDMPGEIGGLLRPPHRWSRLSPYIIPMGHEIAATPIQLAVMMAVIANGGSRVTPYLLQSVQTADGQLVRRHVVSTPVRVLREETAETVQGILADVVSSGTGRQAKVQGLTVAGKTGTAQKIEPTGRYSHSRFVASFVGFGPVPDAQFVMAVSIDEPRPVYYGGSVAAPIFKRIVERLTSYWGLKRISAQPTVTSL